MLVLTRKVGDIIAIGDNIKIVVMAIKGKQVRLGVQADRNTIVHREEIYQKIQQETKAALDSDLGSTRTAGSMLKDATADSAPRPSGRSRLESSGQRAGIAVRRNATPAEEPDQNHEDNRPSSQKK